MVYISFGSRKQLVLGPAKNIVQPFFVFWKLLPYRVASRFLIIKASKLLKSENYALKKILFMILLVAVV